MNDVGVIGAGPVGLALACSLVQNGTRCVVYEKETHKPQISKAFAVHARTLELFRQIGVDQQVIEEGRAIRRMNLYAEKNRLGVVDFANLSSEFPYFISMPQYRLEAILLDRLKRLGGEVLQGHRFVSLSQTTGPDGGVSVVFEYMAAQYTARHRYLVGADGSHSSVRKHLGLAFTGDTYDSEFLVVDAEIDWSGNIYEGHTFLSRQGYLMLMPFPGRKHRIVTDVAYGQYETSPDLREVQALLDRKGFSDMRLSEPDWISTTRYHRRLADHFRKDGVFLAGDACHIHSPVGGQGLNTGIQDAFNLAWRMAMVLDARADERLLDGYELERREVARQVLHNTDTMTRRFSTRNPIQIAVRNVLVPVAFASPKVQRKLVADASGVAIGYRGVMRQRSVSGSPVVAGERLPDVPVWRAMVASMLHRQLPATHYALLYVDGSGHFKQAHALRTLSDRFSKLVRVLLATSRGRAVSRDVTPVEMDPSLLNRFGSDGVAMLLVRPDGYIEHVFSDVEITSIGAVLARVLEKETEIRTVPGELEPASASAV